MATHNFLKQALGRLLNHSGQPKVTAGSPAKVSQILVKMAQADVETVLRSLSSSPVGLSLQESQRRIEQYGLNEIANEKLPKWYVQFFKTFYNPLVILLITLALISLVTGDARAAAIILLIVVFSVLLRFSQEFRSSLAATKLREMVTNTAMVSRSDRPQIGEIPHHPPSETQQQDIPIKFLVPGDVVHLSAGDMIPADVRVLSARDLFVSQGTLTGESLPIEKHAILPDEESALNNPLELTNLCFMGTTIVSGTGMAIVVETGGNTYLGSIAKTVVGQKAMTSFDKGVNGVSFLLLRFMLVMAPVVFLINGLVKGTWIEAFFFALSVAVGLAPEMLPMIVTANLARGAIAMSDKKVIVKNLDAIQSFGAMDILCTDKTGTLTQDKIVLKRHLNIKGDEDDTVLEFAYLNSYYQTGLKNLLDVAVLEHIDVLGECLL
ncbi:HAD-IC family P-type ATPase [Phormidesmis sp. 146-12]